MLQPYCSEFLVHAADVEGLLEGIDKGLVLALGEWCSGGGSASGGNGDDDDDGFPVTYAGGARSVSDLALVQKLSKGRVDLTFGTALDLFGGHGVTLDECVEWNREQAELAASAANAKGAIEE